MLSLFRGPAAPLTPSHPRLFNDLVVGFDDLLLWLDFRVRGAGREAFPLRAYFAPAIMDMVSKVVHTQLTLFEKKEGPIRVARDLGAPPCDELKPEAEMFANNLVLSHTNHEFVFKLEQRLSIDKRVRQLGEPVWLVTVPALLPIVSARLQDAVARFKTDGLKRAD